MKKFISFVVIFAMIMTFMPLLALAEVDTTDWLLQSSVEINTSVADLVARTGDIDNFNFGFATDYDPFSGESTPSHSYPWEVNSLDAAGTDRIMLGTSYNGNPPNGQDGYTGTTDRGTNQPQDILISYDLTDISVNSAAIQIFADDFQAPVWGSSFKVTLNGRRATFLEEPLNQLNQTGPIGKLVTVDVPNEFLSEIASGNIDIYIDDDTTGAGDGFAVDFARVLVNPKVVGTKTISGIVTDEETSLPVENSLVAISEDLFAYTDANGNYTLTGAYGGINSVTATKVGYDAKTSVVDVTSDSATLDIQLKKSIQPTDEAAELVVLTGDIDNFNFGFPDGYDPFSGESTPGHSYPWEIDPNDVPGTDRIMLGTSYNGNPPNGQDGYTSTTERSTNYPQAVEMDFNLNGISVNSATMQIFVDDFQAPVWGSSFKATLNGIRAPFIEEPLNQLNQTGPIGKLLSVQVPTEFLDIIRDGNLSIFIDDDTTGAGDGYAIDFVRLLINPNVVGEKTISGTVIDEETGMPLDGCKVSISDDIYAITDFNGSYTLTGVYGGINTVTTSLNGYKTDTSIVDVTGESANLNVSLIKDTDNNTLASLNGLAVETGVKLWWDAFSEPNLGYRLYRSTDPAEEGISVTDFVIDGTQFVDVNVEAKTTYYYTVRALLKEANPFANEKEVLSEPLNVCTVTTLDDLIGDDSGRDGVKSFILMKLDDPVMTVGTEQQELDPGRGTTPIIKNNRTLIPIRSVVEAMGGQVTWVDSERKIIITNGDITLNMWLDKNEITVNGELKTIDVAPQSINGRTMVPVRFVAENLNCEIEWIASTREIIVVYWK